MGNNAELVVKELQEIRISLPRPMKSLFFDNGIGFINHLLVNTLKNGPVGVDVAWGRSGKSHDPCPIE
jgi:hypothetical protein